MNARTALPCLAALYLSACASSVPQPAQRTDLVRIEHYVTVKSTAPSMAGKQSRLYVREVAPAGPPAREVVLFVHGSGTPAEVTFDVPYKDYSWMAYLARAGYDTFAMDLTGYGRSTRPGPMADACNFPTAQQAQFVPVVISAQCAPSFPTPMTTMSSDWDDIDAVVDHLRTLRGVQKVALIGWSQGGPRTGGYAARHPEKVSRLFVLAPSYARDGPSEPPAALTAPDGPMNAQSGTDFTKNWDRQVGCPGQYESEASYAVWNDMLASDPVGAKWGPGVRRAPTVPTWGFNRAAVAKITTPFAMATGQHDKQVDSQRVRALYEDVGSSRKVLIELGCASHNAMWEVNHLLLFKASLEWLRDGTVNGTARGTIQLGYQEK